MSGPKKTGLGRGLEALFSDVQISIDGRNRDAAPAGSEILFVDINDIKANANQPRKNFSDEKIEELAQSIKTHGIIQPIMVRKTEMGYEIVAGERRWRAARKAQLKEVPCLIKELDDRENMLISIIENVQREDLNVIEEALAFEQMTVRFKLTQEEMSKSVGKSRPYITNALRLLKLGQDIQQMVISGQLSGGHARAIAGLSDSKRQKTIADEIVEKGLSVRQAELIVSQAPVNMKKHKLQRRKTSDPEIAGIEEDLKTRLGTKVKIIHGKKRGKIEIEYYSKEELDRLIDLIMSLN
jgi:ParB family chromosome partitioning protein